MTWTHHGRRAVTVLLVVLALLTVPGVASARFSDRETGGLTASTARLVAPASVTGTYRCMSGFFTEGIEMTVASFVDAGPAGATYRYTLARDGQVMKTSTSASRSATISSGNVLIDGGATDWTLSVWAVVGSWTGPAYERTITCRALSSATGPL